jgi:hypothetical protein
LTTVTSPDSYIPQPAGATAPTSSAAVLAELLKLLPPGTTSHFSDNCIEPLVIDVDHGDGTVVEIDVATCLAWNGHSNPPTQMAITDPQALQIAANPAWGTSQMDAGLVRAAASRFADLPGNTHDAASTGTAHAGPSAGTYSAAASAGN